MKHPLNKDNPNILKSAKDREIGGLGIFITKQVVDDIEYEKGSCLKNMIPEGWKCEKGVIY